VSAAPQAPQTAEALAAQNARLRRLVVELSADKARLLEIVEREIPELHRRLRLAAELAESAEPAADRHPVSPSPRCTRARGGGPR
jgi:hypothetical protein